MLLEKELQTKKVNELFKAIIKLKKPSECALFFRDLCTFHELKEMAERFQIAKGVSNDLPYREISKKTGSSTATITRVAYWYHHGMGGYKLVLKRLK